MQHVLQILNFIHTLFANPICVINFTQPSLSVSLAMKYFNLESLDFIGTDLQVKVAWNNISHI